MNGRPLARLIATLALLVLGGFALARLPLDYLPRHSFPELTVGLTLGEEREPGEVAREWVEPIESAVRSLGRVRGVAGEVRTDGADLTVRFAPGTDPERKAARLDSELARLRARLPEGSTLWVDPAADPQGDLHALVWLSGVRDDAGVRAAAEALRAVPGVRAVEPFGLRDEEVRDRRSRRARSIPGAPPAPCSPRPGGRSACRPSAGAARGTACGRWCRPPRASLASLPIPHARRRRRAARLPGHAPRAQPAGAGQLRFRGQPALALFVYRAHDASPLALDGALRRRLARLPGGVRGEIGWSEATPLRALIRRLALAALLASALAALAGARLAGRWGALSLGLAVPRPWPPPPTPSCWRASP